MTPLRWMLAIGAGATFCASAIVFAAAWADHRARGCLEAQAAQCADARTTMAIAGLVAVAMLFVMIVLMRLLRGSDA